MSASRGGGKSLVRDSLADSLETSRQYNIHKSNIHLQEVVCKNWTSEVPPGRNVACQTDVVLHPRLRHKRGLDRQPVKLAVVQRLDGPAVAHRQQDLKAQESGRHRRPPRPLCNTPHPRDRAIRGFGGANLVAEETSSYTMKHLPTSEAGLPSSARSRGTTKASTRPNCSHSARMSCTHSANSASLASAFSLRRLVRQTTLEAPVAPVLLLAGTCDAPPSLPCLHASAGSGGTTRPAHAEHHVTASVGGRRCCARPRRRYFRKQLPREARRSHASTACGFGVVRGARCLLAFALTHLLTHLLAARPPSAGRRASSR